jgi:hypothetical protein
VCCSELGCRCRSQGVGLGCTVRGYRRRKEYRRATGRVHRSIESPLRDGGRDGGSCKRKHGEECRIENSVACHIVDNAYNHT